jgi:hypothetical protein
MPPGTPPLKGLEAVQGFARQEFALQHRYAMVLHTYEPHPHVHMLLKATSEQGRRLNIRKATLRQWRSEFARHLRQLGVPANATERAVRGEVRTARKDAIYRATLRAESTHMRERAASVARELANGGLGVERGKTKLVETRTEVRHGWLIVSDLLTREGQPALSVQVRRFADQMPLPLTDREWMAAKLSERTREPRDKERTHVR